MKKIKVEMRKAISIEATPIEHYVCPNCGRTCNVLFGFSGEELKSDGQCALCFSEMITEEAGVAVVTYEE